MVVYQAVLEPGVPNAMFARFTANGILAGKIALTGLADLIKKQAKINAYNGHHTYGTPTPATPNHGPATISRTLINSIVRSEVTREIYGWQCQVGMAGNRMPPYNAGPHTSSQYAKILELVGCKNGAMYPFLYPAAKFGFDIGAHAIYSKAYGTNWIRIF